MTILNRLNLMSFLSSLLFYIPIFGLYFTDQGVSLSLIVAGQIVYSVVSMLGEIPTGYLTDRIGQRNGTLIGYILTAIGLACAWLLPNVIGLVLAFALRGLGGAFESGSEEAMVYEQAQKDGVSYTKAWGVFNSYATFGFALATLVAGVLVSVVAEPFNFSLVFILTIIAYIFAALISLSVGVFKHENFEYTHKSLVKTAKDSLLTVKNNRTIFALLIATILTWNAQYVLYDAYQPYMVAGGVNIFFLGASLTAGLILHSILIRYVDRLEKYFGLIKLIVLLNIPIGLLYITFSQISQSPVLLIITFILLQGLFGLHRPIVSDFINSHLQSHIRAISLSAVSFLFSVAKIVLKSAVAFLLTFMVTKDVFLSIGIYIILGTLVAAWNLNRCGCAYKFELYEDNVENNTI